MNFCRVVFPLNFEPLLYSCREDNSNLIKPGMLVTAPVRNSSKRGIVTEIVNTQTLDNIKFIEKIHGSEPLFSKNMLKLLKWMSEYYLVNQGTILKNILPGEFFELSSPSLKNKDKLKLPDLESYNNIPEFDINPILNLFLKSLKKDVYQSYLLYAHSRNIEYSFILGILDNFRNIIILCPEISIVETLYPLLKKSFGERVCQYHSGLSKPQKILSIERIVSGKSDIVIGTRHAVFTPFKKVSLIAVLNEHSSFYKLEKIPFYNIRDIAVMRGYYEKSVVLLSSISPSIESLHNCMSGKYNLLKPDIHINRPKIRIIDTRYGTFLKSGISRSVIESALNSINRGNKVMFVLNKKGYASVVHCDDCGYIQKCVNCGIPLTVDKKIHALKCRYCNYSLSPVPEQCGRCKGYNLQMLGTGTQRIQEELESLTGFKTIRIDSDIASGRKALKSLLSSISSDDIRIIIGTKLMTSRIITLNEFSKAIILNADSFLNFPDFRASEKAYQEFVSIADKISFDGELLVQTRMPQNYLFKYLKKYDYISFIKEELKRRRELNYPPFSKLVLIKFRSGHNIFEKIEDISKKANKNLQILGPFKSTEKQKDNEFSLLLKSSDRKILHETAKIFLNAFKQDKKTELWINVDPLHI